MTFQEFLPRILGIWVIDIYLSILKYIDIHISCISFISSLETVMNAQAYALS